MEGPEGGGPEKSISGKSCDNVASSLLEIAGDAAVTEEYLSPSCDEDGGWLLCVEQVALDMMRACCVMAEAS
jgi:hypothetical protein